MQLHRFDNIQAFWLQAQPYLTALEAEHCLLLGIAHTLLSFPERYPRSPYLALVEQSGTIQAVAIRTPPHKLVLSKVQSLSALSLIAQDLYDNQAPLPGVCGLVTEVHAFLQVWQALTGQANQVSMQMCIHQLSKVEPITPAPGSLRLATERDRILLLNWFEAFFKEAFPSFEDNIELITDSALQQNSAYLWEDSIPVAFACISRSLPSAARIGPVFTPLGFRRRGYATTFIAALSQKLLDDGCRSCFLFTDVANPTSNHIYKLIGYRPVCTWLDCSLESVG
jgi:predicted GNAT family acetyltransferase